ncbi:hypothetical protein PGT21_007958 [Puccinia graminis f. sp. tritici]|uniref:Uncharacterized protein n=1 Tax=Puccinia graminis f. sp. tritici TaxID=56615 RepID=A0A5B0PEC1_PUCGR|nr:hypothetical protein PGT21_007958 [Puccinia graminis f. sp. tritici]KAA1099072.1 hypothetical protein PGTUg99_013398 [Puccinia graminis f. sp. tritici]
MMTEEKEGVGRDIVSGGGIDEFSGVNELEEGVKIQLRMAKTDPAPSAKNNQL